jgi:glycosyltransferase involved in cell wall biosynthesis
MESLTFIIPAYNDGATIETVIKRAGDVGARLGIPFDILVVNDASSDSTGSILKRISKKYVSLHIITHTKNAGYGRTIKELYQKARHPWLFSIPGDYQIEPEELTKLWSRRKSGDMIIGWRRVRRDIPARLRQSHVYNMLLRLLFGLTIHDINSVRLMKTSIMKSVGLTTSSAFVDAELVIRAKRAGLRIMEIPIVHRARTGLGASGGKLTTILPTIRDMIAFLLHL